MKVVVTGAAGFIGANLCRALVASGAANEVVALDDLSTGSRSNLAELDGVRFHEGSILDREALDAVMVGAEAVVHLAARPSVPRSLADPVATNRVNVDGSLEVLEAARRSGAGHVVVASSSSVYGANPVLPKSEGLKPAPMSPYAVSKLAAECYALAYTHSFGLDTLAFRFFNVFGPLQPAGHAYAAVIPAFVAAALAGEPLVVHGDGLQTRDFTFVDTVAAVVVDAVRRRVVSDEPVNLAFGTRHSLVDVIDLLAELVGHPLAVRTVEPRTGDVRHSQADQTLVRSLFPDIEPTPLPEGLRRTIDWFRSTGG